MAQNFAASRTQVVVDAAPQRLSSDCALAIAVVRRDGDAPRLVMASAGASHVFTQLCLALSEAPVGDEPRCIDFSGFGRVTFHKHADDDALIVFSLMAT